MPAERSLRPRGSLTRRRRLGVAAGELVDRAEFYAELPISIRVKGDYHEFGHFISGVAALPRIVTVHDIDMAPGKDGGELTMDMLAKTYRYIDEDEEGGAQ